ncbi:hypothetical protein V2J09_009889 [Rumex salicifolius]
MATLTLPLSAPPKLNISSLLPLCSPSISLRVYSPTLSTKPRASTSSSYHYRYQYADRESDEDDDDVDEPVIGDCLVFEDGIFDDPFLKQEEAEEEDGQLNAQFKKKKKAPEVEPQSLVPDDWKRAVDEINITKKEKRKIAQEFQYGQRLDRKKKAALPLRVNLEEYLKYRDEKLSQVKPLVLQNPNTFGVGALRRRKFTGEEMDSGSAGARMEPKNPRWAVYGRSLEDISEFFNAGKYQPGDSESNSEGKRTLFTKEEKVLINAKMPNLAIATSEKWLPLHTLAASGEFYLATTLLKYDTSINAVDCDGLTALHKAIVCKKQAISNFLLRESANPFVRDKDGATLMHYAVRTASSNAIKTLLLYNVDINLQDNDGWTPLHLAVQGKRTDVVRLLLIKGADTTLRNKDGLTPLELCLYTGQDTRTCQLIKLLKKLPRPHNSLY